MSMDTTYPHFIPKNYLNPWCTAGKVLLQPTGEGEVFLEESALFPGNYAHSITAGTPFSTQKDTDVLFQALKGTQAFYREKQLTSTLEMNQEFDFFEDWELKRRDGSSAKKKPVKHLISQSRIDTKDSPWQKDLEAQWEDVRTELEKGRENQGDFSLTPQLATFLSGIALYFQWETLVEQPLFQELRSLMPYLKHLELPKKPKEIPAIQTPEEESTHWLLVSLLRQFLEQEGVLWRTASLASGKSSFCFYQTSQDFPFYTSDVPSFEVDSPSGALRYFCLTPQILLTISPTPGQTKMVSVSQEEVTQYNQLISQQSKRFVICPQQSV